MTQWKLFMLLLGCRPAGRFTEQHDVFFGIGQSLKDLIPDIKKAWPEAKGNIHIDAWREVTCVEGWSVAVEETGFMQERATNSKKENELFFINLGGYRENEFDEFHYKMLVVADGMESAKSKSKKTAFYKHHNATNHPNNRSATAHIDDKYGIDVDDAYAIKDILQASVKQQFSIHISRNEKCTEDEYHLGYFKLTDL